MSTVIIDENEKYDCMECDNRSVTPLNGLCPHCGSTYLVLAEMDETPATPNKFERVEGIPQWAFPYLMRYDDDEGELSEEDRAELDAFRAKWNIVSDIEGTEDSFNQYPCFGLPCATVDVYATPVKDAPKQPAKTEELPETQYIEYEADVVNILEGEEAVYTAHVTENTENKEFYLTIYLESENFSSTSLRMAYPFHNYKAMKELKELLLTMDYENHIRKNRGGECKGTPMPCNCNKSMEEDGCILAEVVTRPRIVHRSFSPWAISEQGKAAFNWCMTQDKKD